MSLYRRVVAHPRIAPVKPAWQRARRTSAPLRFLVHELGGGARLGRYTVRGAPGAPLALRHGTPDAETLDQILLQDAVAPPAPVAALLDGLGRPPVVIDLGANIGHSAAWFSARWPGARVVCVEPDPDNLAVLRDAAARSGGAWEVVAAAAAASDGTVELSPGGFSMAHVVASGGTRVPAVDAFALCDRERPDLLKIDIEGSEWELLRDARLPALAARTVALEIHPRGAGPDPPGTAAERLLAAGFAVERVAFVHGAAPGTGMLWAWRR